MAAKVRSRWIGLSNVVVFSSRGAKGGVALKANVLIAPKFALGLTSKLSCASATEEIVQTIEAATPVNTRRTVPIEPPSPTDTVRWCKAVALASARCACNRAPVARRRSRPMVRRRLWTVDSGFGVASGRAQRTPTARAGWVYEAGR